MFNAINRQKLEDQNDFEDYDEDAEDLFEEDNDVEDEFDHKYSESYYLWVHSSYRRDCETVLKT